MLGCLMKCSSGRSVAGLAKYGVAIASISVAATGSFAQGQTPGAGSLLQAVPVMKPLTEPVDPIEQKMNSMKLIKDVVGLNLEIKRINITGLTMVSPDDLMPAVSKYIGTNKNFEVLLSAANDIKLELVKRGYFLADAIIPQQKIQDGVVEIFVIEGHFGTVKVDYEPGVEINRELVDSYVSALKSGGIITTAAVERALFLISDLRGIHAKSVFKPGDKVGTADLVIMVSKAKSFDYNIDFDANGSRYTGIIRGGVGVDANNLLGQGDFISLRESRSLDTGGMEYLRASFLTPVSSWGTKVGGSYSALHYRLGTKDFDPLKASGRAAVTSFIGVQPFIRSRDLNLMVMYQFDDRKLHDVQDASGSLTDKVLRVNSIILSGDLRDNVLGEANVLGGGINVGNIAFTGGRVNFVQEGMRLADLAGRKTQGDYTKANLTYSRLQKIMDSTGVYFSYSQQWANNNLDASEKFSLGGPSAVRAYPQGEGAGDEGYLSTVELRYGLTKNDWVPGSAAFTMFYDYAGSHLNKFTNSNDLVNTVNISGVGAGLNWEDPNNWTLRTTAAWRTKQKPTSETVERHPRIYLQLSKFF